MSLSRRDFIVFAAAGAVLPAVGCVGNPAPVVEAAADRTLALPAELSEAGSQVKVVVPGSDAPVLVWRTKIGFGGISTKCGYCAGELRWVAEGSHLQCGGQGCRYTPDGNVLRGPAKQPMRVFLVDLRGEKLHILG
jgi:Rieske Fe-S protein